MAASRCSDTTVVDAVCANLCTQILVLLALWIKITCLVWLSLWNNRLLLPYTGWKWYLENWKLRQ